MNSADAKWEVRRRLEEIDKLLHWTGSVGRKDIINKFGISPQQASTDLKKYFKNNGEHVEFDHSSKRYLTSSEFTPFFIEPSFESFNNWIQESERQIVLSIPTSVRNISESVLKDISKAIFKECSVEILYKSLNNPTGKKRIISPHHIVFTGTRYHVRAYCYESEDFRDFVLGRIVETGELFPQSIDVKMDVEWNTLIIVRIGAHPELTPEQRQVIESDFLIQDGECQVRVRQALLLYFLNMYMLDEYEYKRTATTQQIVLLNPEVRTLIKNENIS